MTAHAYTEDQLVERPAIRLFTELGWQTVSAMEEVFGQSGTLGRETSGDVVLVPRLCASLERLNPPLPVERCVTAAHARRGDSLLPWLGLHRMKPAVLKSQLS